MPGRRRGSDADRRAAPRLLLAAAREPRKDTPGARPARSRRRCSRTSTSSTWERLEEALIMADVGAATTAAVVAELETQATRRAAQRRGGDLRAADRAAGRERRQRRATSASTCATSRRVILMVGVNGTGKTTTLGKLAWQLRSELQPAACCSAPPTPSAPPRPSSWRAGRSARAARSSPARQGSDPGAVAFEAVAQARARGFDVVIIDTAGRLHNQDAADGRAREGPPRDRPPARGRAARDAADDRRDAPARTGCARRSCSRRPSRSAASC